MQSSSSIPDPLCISCISNYCHQSGYNTQMSAQNQKQTRLPVHSFHPCKSPDQNHYSTCLCEYRSFQLFRFLLHEKVSSHFEPDRPARTSPSVYLSLRFSRMHMHIRSLKILQKVLFFPAHFLKQLPSQPQASLQAQLEKALRSTESTSSLPKNYISYPSPQTYLYHITQISSIKTYLYHTTQVSLLSHNYYKIFFHIKSPG